jgi:hypothetical protein
LSFLRVFVRGFHASDDVTTLASSASPALIKPPHCHYATLLRDTQENHAQRPQGLHHRLEERRTVPLCRK